MTTDGALTIERLPIDDLRQDPANLRTHGDRNLDAIKASLARFGQQKPIVVNKAGMILAGNGTFRAAKALGWTHLNVVRTDLAGAEAVAYAIADNRTAELADWGDREALARTLAALQKDPTVDHLATGFSDEAINELVAEHLDVPDFDPVSEDEQSRLDERAAVECPNCGHSFHPAPKP